MVKTGECFNLEREMVSQVRSWLTKLGLTVKEEFPTPWGICDLVGVSFRKKGAEQRKQLGQLSSIGPLARIEVFNRIPDVQTNRSVKLADLLLGFGGFITEEELTRHLQHLIRSRFVTVTQNGHLQRRDGWVPLHKKIVAVELKLSRVEDALDQASSHLVFATHAYVAFPEELALRVVRGQRRAEFEAAGIGIIGVLHRGARVLLPSRSETQRQTRTLQMHCVERFWRTQVTGS